MKIDINNISDFKKLLKEMKTDDPITVTENFEEKYVLMTTEAYDEMQEAKSSNDMMPFTNPEIQVIGPEDLELSEDDIEELKKVLMRALEEKMENSNSKSRS